MFVILQNIYGGSGTIINMDNIIWGEVTGNRTDFDLNIQRKFNSDFYREVSVNKQVDYYLLFFNEDLT